MQMSLMVAITSLVGLASAGAAWFGIGLVHRLQVSAAALLAARRAKAAAGEEPPQEGGGGR